MTLNDDLSSFEEKFRQKELHLADCGAWSLSVRPGQLTLGAMVLACRTGALAMADLSAREFEEMGRGLALAERLARQVFGAQRVNFLCLMMQDPIVHFHVLPRYSGPVDRCGVTWHDREWPGPPGITPIDTADSILLQVREALRAGL